MKKILSDINNFFFKSNINNLISDLKQKNFTNTTVLKYLEKIPREIFVEKKIRWYLLWQYTFTNRL